MRDRSLHLESTSAEYGRTPRREEPPAPERSLSTHRPVDAAAKTVLCCAAVHTLILFVYATSRGDASVFNVFTMLEAQRLWPALATAPAAPWWSFLALLTLYGVLYGTLARGRREPSRDARAAESRARGWFGRLVAGLPVPATAQGIVAPGFARRAPVNGAPLPALHDAPDARSLVSSLFHFQPSLRDGVLMLVGGLALHMVSLAAVERFVSAFPPVPDVLHMHLPYVDFGPPGELVYAAFLATIVTVLVKRQPGTVPAILFLLGVFYGLRGVFLFLLPIGIPPTAPALEARFVLWPFAGHAYFPGGHTGMMTLLSLSVASRSWRRAFLVATFAFAFGTLLSRTHYAADALGGWCIGYAIVLWGRRHVVMRPASHPAKPGTPWSPAARREQEV